MSTGSPHLSPPLHRLVFSVQLRESPHPSNLHPPAQPLRAPPCRQPLPREIWTALQITKSSQTHPFFLLLVIWYRACSALWADMLDTPQRHSSLVAQRCQYVFERGFFLYAPQAFRRQGEDSLPLPHPILYFHRLCS